MLCVDGFYSVYRIEFSFRYHSYFSVLFFSNRCRCCFFHFGVFIPFLHSQVFVSAFLFLKLNGGVKINLHVFSGGKFSCLNVALVHMSSPNAIWMASLKQVFFLVILFKCVSRIF